MALFDEQAIRNLFNKTARFADSVALVEKLSNGDSLLIQAPDDWYALAETVKRLNETHERILLERALIRELVEEGHNHVADGKVLVVYRVFPAFDRLNKFWSVDHAPDSNGWWNAVRHDELVRISLFNTPAEVVESRFIKSHSLPQEFLVHDTLERNGVRVTYERVSKALVERYSTLDK